ncbi:MAG: UDP-N-acetyl glucosamine 2-epimerase [Planctomycetota bacterium]|nr:UDP-N-acetyl glucosamine 2-epimerase [Planctomycetota bacterium]
MTILVVAGARPQFVKAAALMPALPDAELVHTGQHRDPRMVDAHFEGLGLAPPSVTLDVDISDRTARLTHMSLRLVDVIRKRGSKRVLALGDTDSAVATAMAGEISGTPVGHVEAGARSGEPDLPEETNRIVIDRLSDLCFCSTPQHASNLGDRDGVHVVGDVMADVLMRHEDEIRARRRDGDEYAVLTLHRAATADDPETVAAVLDAVAGAAGVPVLFPRHPRTPLPIEPDGLVAMEPLSYLDFLGLVAGAQVVVTDSGGLQKEAYLLGVPCITLREKTEWGETVDAGWNVLAGVEPARIRAALAAPPRAGARPSLYGDGRAAERIAELV